MQGHIKQRSKGSWSVVLFIGFDSEGKRKYKWHTVHGTKKDAQREMNRLLHEMNTGAYVEPSKMTVAAYLKKWLQDYAKTNVAAKTYERYAEIVNNSLIPSLGHHHLEKLKPLHIQSHYSQALESGRKNGKGGLSAQTVLHHHRILHRALQQAVKWQLLSRNPVDAVEPPRIEKKEMNVFSDEQVSTLLEECRGTMFYLPVVLAVATGMRRGEILALRWQDVDLDSETLCVRRSVQQTRDGLSFKEPKTAKARRVVVLPEMAIHALRQHKSQQAEEKLALGQDYTDQGLICALPDGSIIRPSVISDNIRCMFRKMKLSSVRFHDLRHTHATILLREGVHPKVVSERLGHSTIGITMNTYSHVLPSMQEEAARKLDNVFRAASVTNRKDSVA